VAERLIPLGEIVATHGIDGRLKLKPYNPQTTTLSSIGELFLERSGVSSRQELDASRAHKSHFLIKLRGIDRIADAEPWVGSVVSVAEESLQALEPGEYYQYQVIGLNVFDVKGVWIGTITNIWSTAGGDLLVISGATKEHLVPAVKEMIEKVDLSAGKVIINPPEGLLDL